MERLVLVGAGGFLIGITAVSLSFLGWIGAGLISILCAAFAALWFFTNARLYAVIAVLCLGVVIGAGRTLLVPTTLPVVFESRIGTQADIIGIVTESPDIRERTQRIRVAIEDAGEKTTVLVVAPQHPVIRQGETVRATGVLVLPERFETGEGRTFDYEKYLAKDGIFLIMEYAHLEVQEERKGVQVFLGALSDVKRFGTDALSNGLPEPHASLASGLILGGKQGLGEELLDAFMRSGLIHIVVLSGYNVMIVAEFVLRVMQVTVRRYAATAAGIAVLLFVLAAGAGAASIRAGIMAAIALYGRATGETYSAFRALLFAGVVMLLINPLLLLHDPGFQLSFVATVGLIFGAPLVERMLAWVKSDLLRQILGATIAAQVTVLPLLLYQNGLLSLVSLPANVLVLPFVPFTMLASFISLVCGALIPIIAPVCALPAYLFLSSIIGAVEALSALPFAALSIPAFPFAVVVMSYAVLTLACVLLHRRFNKTLLAHAPGKVL